MQRKQIIVATVLGPCLIAGCGSTPGILRPSYGAVVKYEVMPGSTEKLGIAAVTDEGKRLFGHAALDAPQRLGMGGGTSSYGGAGIPKWVRVTWREDVVPGKYWTTGKVVGDYTVEVASRIPEEVLKYASQGAGRAIYLTFRIKDDGVLLSWSVQETVRHPKGGSGRVYSFHGGDFSCEEAGALISNRCTTGHFKHAPWYNPQWLTD